MQLFTFKAKGQGTFAFVLTVQLLFLFSAVSAQCTLTISEPKFQHTDENGCDYTADFALGGKAGEYTLSFNDISETVSVNDYTSTTASLDLSNVDCGQRHLTVSATNANGESCSTEIMLFYFLTESGKAISPKVKMMDFTAEYRFGNVALSWATSTEANNDGFEIEHSKNGLVWQKVGFEQGAGIAVDITHYNFAHRQQREGTHFYRLKQKDFGGKTTYSDVVTVEVVRYSSKAYVAPNPTSGSLYVMNSSASKAGQNARYTIINAQGQQLAYGAVTEGDALDMSGMPSGVYYLHLAGDEGREAFTFVKE